MSSNFSQDACRAFSSFYPYRTMSSAPQMPTMMIMRCTLLWWHEQNSVDAHFSLSRASSHPSWKIVTDCCPIFHFAKNVLVVKWPIITIQGPILFAKENKKTWTSCEILPRPRTWMNPEIKYLTSTDESQCHRNMVIGEFWTSTLLSCRCNTYRSVPINILVSEQKFRWILWCCGPDRKWKLLLSWILGNTDSLPFPIVRQDRVLKELVGPPLECHQAGISRKSLSMRRFPGTRRRLQIPNQRFAIT